ncbi:hypothetical protein [Micromonospora sp. NPDC005806]
MGGADGWKKVADQYLQSDALDVENLHHCFHLFYSQYQHFNPDLL